MSKETQPFIDKVTARLDTTDSSLCVGLDSLFENIPGRLHKDAGVGQTITEFNKMVVDATVDLVVGYKMNIPLYLASAEVGIAALRETNRYIQQVAPDVPLFADLKISEIGTGNNALKKFLLNDLGFDCIMLTPWFGSDTVAEFEEDISKGVIVYVHDSNPSARDLQDLELKDGRSLYEIVTEMVVKKWNKNGNMFVEAGATYPEQLRRVREIIGPEMPILTAGIGPQGGKIEDLIGCFGKNGKRLIVNSSRAVIFPRRTKASYQASVKQSATELIASLRKVSRD